MRSHHHGGAKLGVATALALVVGLAGVSGASAAPGDNLRNAGKCLQNGGWQTLHTTSGRSFPGPLSCVIYALRGGTFVTDPTTPIPPSQ
jgi:hypothetical protein